MMLYRVVSGKIIVFKHPKSGFVWKIGAAVPTPTNYVKVLGAAGNWFDGTTQSIFSFSLK